MSVYIKGMKKPENCLGCVFSHVDETTDDRGYPVLKYTCIATKLNSESINTLYRYCPMIDVPTPHGRLVDADDLCTSHYNVNRNGDITGVWYGCTEKQLEDALTVIPADIGEV